MRNYFKKTIILIVFFGFSAVFAGVYEDFFSAINRDQPRELEQLLARGLDPNTVNSNGQPGLLVAMQSRSFKAAAVLLAHLQTQVEVRNPNDESPLMLAALHGQISLCEQLIARDADVNKPGWTPLHYAASNGHVPVIRLLLAQHAYIDAESPNGSTPLMMAAMYGNLDSVQALLDAGADPLLKNQLGLSAIDFALQAKRPEAAERIAKAIRQQQPKGIW